MKVSIDLPAALLTRARVVAGQRGTTLDALVEQGLLYELARDPRATPFVLRDASFAGDGLCPEFADGGWERLRTAIYPPDDR